MFVRAVRALSLKFFVTLVASAPVICEAAPISAGPVGLNNSFTQSWFNANPDNPLGLFDTIALQFVSQSPIQTGFKNVAIRPDNGWTSLGFDPSVTVARGTTGQLVRFDLTFEGAPTDAVQWNIWYYRGGQALGGARYEGLGDPRQPFRFVSLPVERAPTVPEPAALALLTSSMALAWVRRRRR